MIKKILLYLFIAILSVTLLAEAAQFGVYHDGNYSFLPLAAYQRTFTFPYGLNISGADLGVAQSVVINENATATFYFGDGSQLTGVIPSTVFNATYDALVQNNASLWAEAYNKFNSTYDTWAYNQTLELNLTGDFDYSWLYNQTDGLTFWNVNDSSFWWYNQTLDMNLTGTFSYEWLYNQTENVNLTGDFAYNWLYNQTDGLTFWNVNDSSQWWYNQTNGMNLTGAFDYEWLYNQTLNLNLTQYNDWNYNQTATIDTSWSYNQTLYLNLTQYNDWNFNQTTNINTAWLYNQTEFMNLTGSFAYDWLYNQTLDLNLAQYLDTYNATYDDKADYQFLDNDFNGSGTITASTFISKNNSDDGYLWYFDTDRDWAFINRGTGASSQLALSQDGSNKHFLIQAEDTTVIDIQAQLDDATSPLMTLTPNSRYQDNSLYINQDKNSNAIYIDSEANESSTNAGIYVLMKDDDKYILAGTGGIAVTGNISGKYGSFDDVYISGGLVNTTWWFNQTIGLNLTGDFDYEWLYNQTDGMNLSGDFAYNWLYNQTDGLDYTGFYEQFVPTNVAFVNKTNTFTSGQVFDISLVGGAKYLDDVKINTYTSIGQIESGQQPYYGRNVLLNHSIHPDGNWFKPNYCGSATASGSLVMGNAGGSRITIWQVLWGTNCTQKKYPNEFTLVEELTRDGNKLFYKNLSVADILTVNGNVINITWAYNQTDGMNLTGSFDYSWLYNQTDGLNLSGEFDYSWLYNQTENIDLSVFWVENDSTQWLVNQTVNIDTSWLYNQTEDMNLSGDFDYEWLYNQTLDLDLQQYINKNWFNQNLNTTSVVQFDSLILNDTSDKTLRFIYNSSYPTTYIRNYQGQLYIYHNQSSQSPATYFDRNGSLTMAPGANLTTNGIIINSFKLTDSLLTKYLKNQTIGLNLSGDFDYSWLYNQTLDLNLTGSFDYDWLYNQTDGMNLTGTFDYEWLYNQTDNLDYTGFYSRFTPTNVAFVNNSQTNFTGNVTANWFDGGLNWTNLDLYPDACTEGYYVTEIGDETTCTRPTNATYEAWAYNQTEFMNLTGTFDYEWLYNQTDGLNLSGDFDYGWLFNQSEKSIDWVLVQGYDALMNNTIVDSLHRHSELVASDGSPDPALYVDATGIIHANNTFLVEFADATFQIIDNDVGGARTIFAQRGNELHFYDAGYGQTMTLDHASHFVGIGTTNPIAKLDILTGTGDDVKALGFSEDSGQHTFSFETDYAGFGDNNHLRLASVTTENIMTWTLGGNIGIGTTNPQSKLEVVGTSNFTGNATFGDYVGIGTNDPGALLELKESSVGAGDSIIRFRGDGNNLEGTVLGAIEFYNADLTGDGPNVAGKIEAQSYHSTGSGSDLVFYIDNINTEGGGTPGYEAMRIKGTGNVGIGTASPTAKLHVAGGDTLSDANSEGRIATFRGSTANVDFNVEGGYGAGGGIGWRAMAIGTNFNLSSGNVPVVDAPISSGYEHSNVIGFGAENTTDSGLTFWTGEGIGSSLNERMRITKDGNVGIGTDNPTSNIHVRNLIGSNNAYITIENTNADKQSALQLKTATADADWIAYIPASSTDLRFYRGSDLVTFQADGFVGIGTTSPQSKLEVVGTMNVTGNFTSNLLGSYTNGEAYVCVDNSGVIFAKETVCA